MLALAIVSISLLLFLSRVASVIAHYRTARAIGLPIVFTPITWQDPFWLLMGPIIEPLLRRLPLGLGDWARYSVMGWQLEDRFAMHARLGPAFVIVSPSLNEIIIADPAASHEVLSHWRQYVKSPMQRMLFNTFGENLNTVEGTDWQRHRKITGPAFKEDTNRQVWAAAQKEANTVAHRWSQNEEVTLDALNTQTALTAMHILMVAGFGKDDDAEDGLQKIESGHTLSYESALQILLRSIIMTNLFMDLPVPTWVLPEKIRTIKTAAKEFRQYMVERVAEEKRISDEGGSVKSDLMSTLVEANEAAKTGEGAKMVLSADELFGNLFVFNLAGFETTASLLLFALPYMAANSDVQEWVAAEVDQVMTHGEATSFDAAFPRLVRTLAVMVSSFLILSNFADLVQLETLRLWGSVEGLPRYTGNNVQTFNLAGQTYSVPPQTYVTLNFPALHSDPATWGEDALHWRPSRWITQSADGVETILPPPGGPGSYVAWSLGPRSCPGKRFSEAEAVGFIATLLKQHRLEPAMRPGEKSIEEARTRLLATLANSYPTPFPKMRKPLDAGFRLRPASQPSHASKE